MRLFPRGVSYLLVIMLILGLFLSFVYGSSEAERIGAAEGAVSDAFKAVVEAEKAGVNVSECARLLP